MVLAHLPKRKKKAGPHVNYTTPPTTLDAYPNLLKTGKNTLTVPPRTCVPTIPLCVPTQQASRQGSVRVE
jgi:hypothetical protein